MTYQEQLPYYNMHGYVVYCIQLARSHALHESITSNHYSDLSDTYMLKPLVVP